MGFHCEILIQFFFLLRYLRGFLVFFGTLHQSAPLFLPPDFNNNFLLKENFKMHNYDTYFDIFLDLHQKLKFYFELFCRMYSRFKYVVNCLDVEPQKMTASLKIQRLVSFLQHLRISSEKFFPLVGEYQKIYRINVEERKGGKVIFFD